ncbi:MAG: acetoin utilization protein AcuC [Rhodospirillales bacterium]|nr:acetoin utilization protein AcuC [Rhodospirillales bacterium]MBO6787867.1 acetoin utilization protein AcuC [Rhodospirillales bacterium]
MTDAHFIGSEIYRDSTYGSGHPLAIPRVSLAIDLIRALGWFPSGTYVDSPRADAAYLERFHTPEYVAAVIQTEKEQDAPPAVRARHNIGAGGNPIFPEMFRRPATAVGGGGKAAELVAEGGRSFNLGGGQHHGRPDRASGFCYFNEPALTIGRLQELGAERVFYLDLDAHHGDGVQDAFHDDPDVFTLSIHEAGRWPMERRNSNPMQPGGPLDRAGGMARNIPVPPGLNDDELEAIVEGAVLPLIQEFEPDAIFVQCGVDALGDDPQSKLEISNVALWRTVAAVRDMAPRMIASGGGGYNPFSVARGWAGVWGAIAGFDVPARLPDDAEGLLRGVNWRHRRAENPPERWFTTLADPANHGPIRDEIRTLIRTVTS